MSSKLITFSRKLNFSQCNCDYFPEVITFSRNLNFGQRGRKEISMNEYCFITFSENSNSSQCDCDCGGGIDCDCDYHVSSQDIFTRLTTAYIELTSACNNHCIGCGNVFISDKAARKAEIDSVPLPLSEWHKIIAKLAPPVTHINITGGEPTLYSHFAKFISLLDEHCLTFTLFTNARWRSPKETLKILTQAKGLKGLLISLHGKDARTHESFTLTPGAYDETLKNIRLAASAGIPVTLSSIITRYNYTQIADIQQLAQEIGIKRMVFSRYVGHAEDNCAPNPEQLRQALTQIETLRVSGSAVKLSVAIPQCFHPTSALGCGAGKSYITVDPQGNVRPCNHAPLILGNLRRDSLERITNSAAMAYWHNLTPETCRDCSAFEICGGGCKAEAMLNNKPQDSLIQVPFLSGTRFMVLPENLRPVATSRFNPQELPEGINCQIQGIPPSFDGSLTLKEFGIRYGQNMLDCIGAMHSSGMVGFM
jgi:radical SAM protein with 4Fe4S-binding SPASM domain